LASIRAHASSTTKQKEIHAKTELRWRASTPQQKAWNLIAIVREGAMTPQVTGSRCPRWFGEALPIKYRDLPAAALYQSRAGADLSFR